MRPFAREPGDAAAQPASSRAGRAKLPRASFGGGQRRAVKGQGIVDLVRGAHGDGVRRDGQRGIQRSNGDLKRRVAVGVDGQGLSPSTSI